MWYYGRRTPKKHQTLTPGICPAIVSPELWEQARGAIAANATYQQRNRKREYLLAGLVKCGCGHSFCGAYYDKADGSEVRSYRCTRREPNYTNRPGCGTPSVRADLIEPLVWDDVRGFLREPGNVIATLQAERSVDRALSCTAELERVEATLKSLDDAEARLLPLYTGGVWSRDKLNREASRLEVERNAALRGKAELDRERAGEEAKRLRLRDVRRQLETLAERLDAPTFDQKQ